MIDRRELEEIAARYRLTAEHAASSYGIPVLVDAEGEAYGRGDLLPEGLPAALVYEVLERLEETPGET